MKILLQDVSTTGHRIEYAKYLIKHFVENDHDVFYCTRGQDDRLQRLRECGATVRIYPKLPSIKTASDVFAYQISLTKYIHAVFNKADDWNIDVVHLLDMDGTESSLLPALLKNSHSDWKFFGTYFSKRLITSTKNPLARTYRGVRRLSLKCMARLDIIESIFVLHRRIKRDYVDSLSISDDFISVIPDPIEPPTSNSSCQSARNYLSLPEEGTILLFFGSARYNKGPDILLDALSLLDGDDLTVVFAGTAGSVDTEDISQAQSQTGIEIISRLDFIPDEDIYKYFFATDAVLLPYRTEYQGTSGVLQRSIATRRPVISTDCGLIGSIVKEWDAGLVVEPDSPTKLAQGIQEYLDNKGYYDQLATDRADEYVQRHHWENFAKRVLETYTS